MLYVPSLVRPDPRGDARVARRRISAPGAGATPSKIEIERIEAQQRAARFPVGKREIGEPRAR
jgi:hypothetical protein